jgi:hypothetical protein
MFVFGVDLVDEGIDTVLGNLRDRAGVDAVSLSATYHDARDVLPHNPRRTVYRHEGDVAWFQPRPSLYPEGHVPPVATDAGGRDLLAELCSRAEHIGLDVQAWTIYTHNSRISFANPTSTTQNAFGDRIFGDLCPANPQVQDYFLALTADVCRYPIQRLLVEALHYRPFEHGDHHERCFVELDAAERALLGLCFCAHCTSGAAEAGIDVESLSQGVRTVLHRAFTDERPDGPGDRTFVETLNAYTRHRESVVTDIAARVQDVASSQDVSMTFIDHGGAMPHVMKGLGADESPRLLSSRLGIDPAATAKKVDEFGILGYRGTAQELRDVVDAYRPLLGDHPTSMALRPMAPDCTDPGNLAEKVAVAAEAGLSRVDFYHYALAPLNRLDWIAQALDRVKT